MNNKIFDHIGLVNIGRHWPSLPEDNIIPQKLCSHFMSKQLDASTAYNFNYYLSGPYQHGGTSSLTAGNLIGMIFQSRRYTLDLGRWSWQKCRGIGEVSIRIITFCVPFPPTAGGVPGSVYAQHLTQLSNLRKRGWIRTALLSDLSGDIITWNSKGDQIILMVEINEYILSKTIRNFATKLGLRELITYRHRSMRPEKREQTKNNRQ